MSELPSDTFAFVFVRQIYTYCYEWLHLHPDKRDAEVDFNIGMLCHICHPKRWTTKGPTKNEIDAITTLLGSVIEPCFREKAPDLWEQIDRASTTFAIYSMPNFKAFGPNGAIIEEEEQPAKNKPTMHPVAPPSSPLRVSSKDLDEDEEEFVVATQKRAHPLVEVENLGDDDDDDDDDDEGDELIEVPDISERDVETFSTPKRKRAKPEVPPAPRVLRKKIIVWSTTATSQDKEKPESPSVLKK